MDTKACEGRRPRGRPQARSDAETRLLIAEAAVEVFAASGYDAASMDDVARGAAVSKRTLYRLVPTKAELFSASVAERIHRFILALDEDKLASMTPEDALVRTLTEYGRLTLSPGTIALQKLVFAESDRFPELARVFYRDAMAAIQGVFVRCLGRLCRDGLIERDDLDEAAGMLRGMMVFEPWRGAMLGQARLPTGSDIERRARRCARLFIEGSRSGPPAKAASSP